MTVKQVSKQGGIAKMSFTSKPIEISHDCQTQDQSSDITSDVKETQSISTNGIQSHANKPIGDPP